MTNFELAQALVRLGAVTARRSTAAARRRWRSTGTLLNRPSDPTASGRSPSALLPLLLRRLRAAAAEPSLAERRRRRRGADARVQDRAALDRDGDADRPGRRRRASVDAGAQRARRPYRFRWPAGGRREPAAPRAAGAGRRPRPTTSGRTRDRARRSSSTTRSACARRRRARRARRGERGRCGRVHAHAARDASSSTVETPSGRRSSRTLRARRLPAGARRCTWDGRDRDGAAGTRGTLRRCACTATNERRDVELTDLGVRVPPAPCAPSR